MNRNYRCDLEINRDINAAISLASSTLGLRGFQACGDGSSGFSGMRSETTVNETGTNSIDTCVYV